MSYKYKFTVGSGDECHDGHGLRCNIPVECTHSATAVGCAIDKAKINLQIPKDLCQNYEDDRIPEILMDRLIGVCGMNISEVLFEYYGDKWYVNRDSWMQFHMWLASTELEDFKYKVLPLEQEVWIGGYGLYHG
jgi:hypothetical protein